MQFLLFKSESTLNKCAMLFDVGHGDSLLFLDCYDRGLLVDCGSQRPNSHIEVPKAIESVLPKNNSCGFIVSHYHFDHYSLFHWLNIPESLFSKIYVPWIPLKGPGLEIGHAVMTYLSAAVLADYSYYRILPEIFERTNFQFFPCKKGDNIKEASQRLKVLWPDISNPILGTKKIRSMAYRLKRSIDPLLTDLGFKISISEKEESIVAFFSYLKDLKEQELPNEEKGRI